MGGCGATSPTVDDGPFREAIKQYLRQRDMALAIKQIKSGPEVTGETAVLTASMTHKDLPGPAVTWKVFFQKDAGKWRVARHEK